MTYKCAKTAITESEIAKKDSLRMKMDYWKGEILCALLVVYTSKERMAAFSKQVRKIAK